MLGSTRASHTLDTGDSLVQRPGLVDLGPIRAGVDRHICITQCLVLRSHTRLHTTGRLTGSMALAQ
jgi:hypothetical protein